MRLDWPFGDHMVLQRNKELVLRGQGDDGWLKVCFLGETYQTAVIKQRWQLRMVLDTVGGPYSMTIINNDKTYLVEDIMIGDVFLAAGQSNMEYKLNQTAEYDELLFDQDTNIRYCNVPQYAYQLAGSLYPKQERKGWLTVSSANAGDLSAVAYYFARNVALGVPIGIIVNSKGGTSASAWVGEEYLSKDDELYRQYYTNYYQDLEKISFQEQYANHLAFNKKLRAYQKNYQNYLLKNPGTPISQLKQILGHSPWPPPKGYYDFRRPCGLYQLMFKQTVTYPIKAVLWYQGEEDAPYAKRYARLLELLIQNWRADYRETIPFFVVQLPEYAGRPVNGFSDIRLAQSAVYRKLAAVFLIVTLGLGEKDNVHPDNKRDVGFRLAQSVRVNLYQLPGKISPDIKKVEKKDKYFIIYFNQTLRNRNEIKLEASLKNNTSIKILAFTEDNKLMFYYQPNIKTISYACSDVPDISIIGINGLPVSPFIMNIEAKNRYNS